MIGKAGNQGTIPGFVTGGYPAMSALSGVTQKITLNAPD